MYNYKLNIVIMLAFLGTAFIGCDPTDIVDDDDDPVETVFSTTLTGTDEYPEVSGEGEVVSLDTEFTASVSISGAEPGQEHPWHVHEGTCESGGAIIGPADSYPFLEVDDDGNANATVTIFDTALVEGNDYHINVHLSEDELQTIVACGDLNGEEDDIDNGNGGDNS